MAPHDEDDIAYQMRKRMMESGDEQTEPEEMDW